MEIQNFLRNFLKPKSATGFVDKFIKDSSKRRVHLELIYKNDLILQVDPLKFLPSWFELFNVNQTNFKNGFVIFLVLDRKGIEKNKNYINYQESGIELMELDEMHGETPIRTFAKFVKWTNDPVLLGKEMRVILEGVFKSSIMEEQAIFNLRYIKKGFENF